MNAILRQASNLEVHDVPDGYIVYQSELDQVHYLNNTAAIIFELCDGKRESEDIIARVATAFEVGPSACAEIRAGLDSLLKEGLVQSSSK
jgi:hypothetical protein